MICAALAIGVHLGSIHLQDHRNNINPGISVECDGVIAGTYKNSFKDQATYLGYRVHNAIGPLDADFTVVHGYRWQQNVPAVSLSYKLDNGLRVTLFPARHGVGGLHFGYEF